MEKLLQEVLERIKPSKEEEKELKKFANSVLSKIRKKGYKASLEGSLAKDTWVSGDHDVDVFAFFDKKVPRADLEQKGISLGKQIAKELGGRPEIAYAEHPYVRTRIGNIVLDIVPCYKHKSLKELHSAVDRTPFHTRFIQKNLNQKKKAQARLLKQFMKGIGVYSAKEKVRGFSGYLCELLILKYGTFLNVIKQAKRWNYGFVIDSKKYYKDTSEAFKKFDHALVVVDPIDKDRNVAAALELDNFETFIVACNQFLKHHSKKFFFPHQITPYSVFELNKKIEPHGKIIVIKFNTPNVVEDVLYSQLRRSVTVLGDSLQREEFKVLDSAFFTNAKSYFMLEFVNTILPKLKKLEGPPTKVEQKYQDAFLKKYKKYKPWISRGRWYVEVPRKFTIVEGLIKNSLRDPRRLGISKDVSSSIKKNYNLITGKKILKEYKGEFAEFLTSYLSKKKPWEW